jgi:hypothetical protein
MGRRTQKQQQVAAAAAKVRRENVFVTSPWPLALSLRANRLPKTCPFPTQRNSSIF